MLSSRVPKARTEQSENIPQLQMDRNHMQVDVACLESILKDTISEILMALEANHAIAQENKRLADTIKDTNCGRHWHDAADAFYDDGGSMGIFSSSSLEAPARNSKHIFLTSDMAVMGIQADDLRSSYQQYNNSNAIQSPGKAASTANLFPESLEQSFSERQAAKLQMVRGAQASSHTPPVEVQDSLPSQSTLETQPFCAVFPPQSVQAKCRQTMRFSAVDANYQARAAPPLHSLRFGNGQQAPSYKLSAAPQAAEEASPFSARTCSQFADACTFAHIRDGQLPGFIRDDPTAQHVAQECMCGASCIQPDTADGKAEQFSNVIGSSENIAGAADLGEMLSNQQPAPESSSKPVKTLPPGVTTLVVRNVPARFTQEQLLQLWPVDGTYDVMYLPYSFLRKRRSGLVFINMVSHEAALNFAATWHGRKIANVSSAKRLDIGVAEVQGFMGNLKHLKASNITRMRNVQFLPVAFNGTQKLDFKSLLAGFLVPAN